MRQLAIAKLRLPAIVFMLLLAGCRSHAASVTLSLPDGAKISDTVTVTARVTGFEDAGVQRVEFFVDGKSRGEDASIPYTFEWNTLDDAEGEHTLEAVATDMNGSVARASVRVVIDNELSLGADRHGVIALEALANKDTDTAQRHARRALKLDPTNLAGARVLAALYKNSRDYDKAIAVLESAAMTEKETTARRELAALYVLRGDAGNSTESLVQGISAAYEQYKRYLEARAAAATHGTPEEKGDAAFAARKWAEAINAYQSAGDPATIPLSSVNRLFLAYARAGRTRDVDLLMRTLTREKRGDLVTEAVRGYHLLQTHQPEEARRVVQRGVDAAVLPALIVAACSDLIVNDRKRAEGEIATAAFMAPDDVGVLYLQAVVAKDPLDARAFCIRALAADPSSVEVLVRMAFDVMASKQKNKEDDAEALLNLARRIDPQSIDTLVALGSLLMVRDRPHEAQPLFEKALELDKDAPDALVGEAINCSLLDQTRTITDLLAHAGKVDNVRWDDALVPKPLDYLNRVMRYRITPILTPQTLYPGG